MKINKILSIVLVAIVTTLYTSCVKDANFEVPQITKAEENAKLNQLLDSIKDGKVTVLSIQDVKDKLFTTRKARLVKADYVVKGYVSSSDESGNFYKMFYIQDAVKDPTAGLKIALNKKNSYTQFNQGREVYIRLKGLYVGESDKAGDREVTVGGFVRSNDTRLEPVSENQIPNHIFRTDKTMDLEPLVVALKDINYNHVGLLVKVEGAHFAKEEVGLTYFDPNRSFDTERTIQTCNGANYDEFKLETSSFANFAGATIPQGGGSIKAVVIKDYDRNVRLAINSLDDVKMDGDRCKLLKSIFEENFESYNKYDKKFGSWTNINANNKKRVYQIKEYRSNKYAEISAYRSNENPMEAWLVSPAIDLDNTTEEKLTFKTKTGYNNAKTLSVYYSTDFSGDVKKATWTKLNATLADGPSRGFSKTFVDSGELDLSAVKGKVYIGFKYLGKDTRVGKQTTTFQIDDVVVIGKE